MRIVYVTHVAFPDVAHDPFHSRELAKKMTARGHKTTIITWNKQNPTTNSIERVDDVDFWRLHGVNFKLNNIITEYPFVFGMNSAFKQLQPDIIHVHSHLFATSVQAVTKAKKMGLPTVMTVHGVFADRALPINLAQHTYLRTFGSMILKNADRIVCLTRSDVNEIMRLGCPRERIRLVPNAVNTVRFRPGKRRKDNLIVWVGRFVPEKGLEYLIGAARMTAKKVKDARFLLIGYGPMKAKIEKLACDYGLLGRVVTLAGPLEAEEVAEILGKATVFVLSSLKEGLPISLL
jgi:glycosyltransferase involved in cell wall biosynthesis